MSVFGGPNAITNGLVLHLDASNPRSYPGAGTTWFDVSGNGNNGTLTNMSVPACYVKTYGGRALDFDGMNDYVATGATSGWGISGSTTGEGQTFTVSVNSTSSNTANTIVFRDASGVFGGTAVTAHDLGATVYNLNRDNLAPLIYQDHYVGSNTLGDGSTTIFTTDVDLSQQDSAFDTQAIRVYVGGLLQTSGYTVTSDNPVTVEFDTAPTAGYQITIQIRQGLGWYGAGVYETTGTPLQDATTVAAQFFRG